MREILSIRDRGVEALIAGLPVDPAQREVARRFAMGLTNSLAKWDRERRVRRSEGRQHG